VRWDRSRVEGTHGQRDGVQQRCSRRRAATAQQDSGRDGDRNSDGDGEVGKQRERDQSSTRSGDGDDMICVWAGVGSARRQLLCAGTAPRPHQKDIRPLGHGQQLCLWLCPSASSHTAGGSRCCLPGFVRPVMSRLAGAQRRHSLPAALLPCCPWPAAALVRLLPCLRPVPAPSAHPPHPPFSHLRTDAHSMTCAACSPDPTWPATAEFSPPD
jgi:hypothetical protein